MSISPRLDETLLALAHLICGDQEASRDVQDRAVEAYHRISPGDFDGFELWTTTGEDGPDDDWLLMGDNAGDLPFWPIDVRWAAYAPSDWPPGTWQFGRIHTLDRKAWRGRLLQFTPRMVEWKAVISPPNGKQVHIREPIMIANGRGINARTALNGFRQDSHTANVLIDPSWFGMAGNRHWLNKEDADRATGMMRIAAGMSLRLHYRWSVLLGEGCGPRARFTTDAIGLREVFRLRDIPPGKARRAALLHWVRTHWRQSRSASAEDRSWVREHLRGARSFDWNGLRCEIEPSGEDIARASLPRERVGPPGRAA